MVAVVVCIAYALGCISPGWWLVRRATGADLRRTGSGATGATNAARVLGPRAFVLVLLVDAAKAAAAVRIGQLLAGSNGWWVLTLPAAVAGHIWPAPLRFKGGRGAGPLLGGCLALNPLFAVATAIPAACAALITRRQIVVTATAAAGGLAAAWWLLPTNPARVAFSAAMALVLLAHRSHFMRAWQRSVT